LIVENESPMITGLSSSHPTPALCSLDGEVAIAGGFTDAGGADVHTVTVNWGDSTVVETLSVDQLNGAFSGGHHYSQGGIFIITVTVTDNDGSAVTQTTTAAVCGVGLVDGTLYIIGTPARDKVDVDLVNGNHGTLPLLRVKFNSEAFYYDPAQVSQIALFRDADDHVKVNKNVDIDILLLDGAGELTGPLPSRRKGK
jgi:hypothetical protein